MSYLQQFQNNIDKLLCIRSYKGIKFAIAVSAGADSMFLLHLCVKWANKVGALLLPVIVDHQLRNVDKDIQVVKSYCDACDLQPTVLQWHHSQMQSHIQAKARKARYSLISDFCVKHDIFYVFCGHNAEDIVENFFLRMNRKSGLSGLSSNKVSILEDIFIVRPIFNFHKQDYINYLTQHSIQWVEDPTNQSQRFTRNRIRFFLEEYQQHLAPLNNLLDFIRNIDDAHSILMQNILSAYVHSVFTSFLGYAVIELDAIECYSKTVQYFILYYALISISGVKKLPRISQVRFILDNIWAKNGSIFSLNHCRIYMHKRNFLLIYKVSDIQKSQLLKNMVVWDNRFEFTLESKCENLTRQTPIYISSIKRLTHSKKSVLASKIINLLHCHYLSQISKKELNIFIASIPVLRLYDDYFHFLDCIPNEKIIFSLRQHKIVVYCAFVVRYKLQFLFNAFYQV